MEKLASTDNQAHALAHHISNCLELHCSDDSTLNLIAPFDLSEGKRYNVNHKQMND